MKPSAAIAVTVVGLLAGCTLFHGDNSDRGRVRDGGNGSDDCDITYGDQVLLVNPYSLACEPYYASGYCDPSSCDSCPIFSDGGSSLPQWGSCQSSCLGKSRDACGISFGCRVVLESGHYFGTTVGDPYLGCYPSNNEPPFNPDPCSVLDATGCSSVTTCISVYYAPDGVDCPIDRRREACPGATFVGCVGVGIDTPGECLNPSTTITCATSPPICTGNATPGVANGCYTGACIPQQYCVIPD